MLLSLLGFAQNEWYSVSLVLLYSYCQAKSLVDFHLWMTNKRLHRLRKLGENGAGYNRLGLSNTAETVEKP